MTRKLMLERTRFFISGEGASEQSFVKFLGMICEQCGIRVHLDCPASAHTLARKFTLADLLRVARIDAELNTLLSIIGLRHE